MLSPLKINFCLAHLFRHVMGCFVALTAYNCIAQSCKLSCTVHGGKSAIKMLSITDKQDVLIELTFVLTLIKSESIILALKS